MKMLNKHIINIRESMHLDRSKFTSLLLDSIYSLEEEKRREEKRREEKRREEKNYSLSKFSTCCWRNMNFVTAFKNSFHDLSL